MAYLNLGHGSKPRTHQTPFFFGFCQAQCVWQCLTYQAIWIIWSSGHVISADRSEKNVEIMSQLFKFWLHMEILWKFYGNSKIWTQIRWKFCSTMAGHAPLWRLLRRRDIFHWERQIRATSWLRRRWSCQDWDLEKLCVIFFLGCSIWYFYRYIQVYIILYRYIISGFHHGSTMDAMDLGKVPWGFTMVKSMKVQALFGFHRASCAPSFSVPSFLGCGDNLQKSIMRMVVERCWQDQLPSLGRYFVVILIISIHSYDWFVQTSWIAFCYVLAKKNAAMMGKMMPMFIHKTWTSWTSWTKQIPDFWVQLRNQAETAWSSWCVSACPSCWRNPVSKTSSARALRHGPEDGGSDPIHMWTFHICVM